MMTRKTRKCIPTLAIAKNALKGLKMQEKFGYGGTKIRIGLTRAHQLSSRKPVTYNVIKKMVNYFTLHEVGRKTENFNNEESPSEDYVAWLLWGGDEGRKWALRMKKEFEHNV